MSGIWSEDLSGTTLLPFLIRAKKATYVGDGDKAPASRVGSNDLTYQEGNWSYRDSYFGGTDFLGQETAWHESEPVWSMCYYGYILRPDLITAAEAGTLLKAALSRPESQGRLLDNLTLTQGTMVYEITSHGAVGHFRGRETIHVSGILAYALDYFGGLIKP